MAVPEAYRPARPGKPLLAGPSARPAAIAAPLYRAFRAGTDEVGALPDKAPAERLKLGAYLGAIFLASLLRDPLALGLCLAGVLALAGRDAARLARRALLACLLFSAVVSLGYVAERLWQGAAPPWDWLLSANLRVLLMTMLTFLFIARCDLFAALAFSRRLSFILVLALSQAIGLRRTLSDFRLALQARGPRRTALRARYRAAAHAAVWLLDRALANAHESAQAMQARGMFK